MKAKRKTSGDYMTTRAQYKAAKGYDHRQFDDFCRAIYTEGVKDGKASVPGVDLTAVIAQIQTIKGIGAKRLAQIEAAVGTLFKEKEDTTK